MDYSLYLAKAVELARAAGEIQLSYFRNPRLASQTKLNSFDVVTEADKASERLILDGIRSAFPGHAILSEESGKEGAKDAEWLWVIDPLDGTTNFNQGLPVFSVSIALQHHGATVVGVVYAPYLGELFTAVKDHGAYLNGKPIYVRHNTDLGTMVVATGMPYDRDRHPDNNLDNISRVCLRVRGTRRMGSAAIDLAYTAAGYYDAYWELNLNPWDVDAGILLVQEAGGIVGSLRENRNQSVIAGSAETLEVFRPLIK